MEQPPARNIRLRLSSNPESYRAVEIVDVGEYASSTLASTRRSRLGVRSKVALGIHNPCAGEGEKLKGYNWDTSQEHWADKTRAEDTKYRRGKINEAKKDYEYSGTGLEVGSRQVPRANRVARSRRHGD